MYFSKLFVYFARTGALLQDPARSGGTSLTVSKFEAILQFHIDLLTNCTFAYGIKN